MLNTVTECSNDGINSSIGSVSAWCAGGPGFDIQSLRHTKLYKMVPVAPSLPGTQHQKCRTSFFSQKKHDTYRDGFYQECGGESD